MKIANQNRQNRQDIGILQNELLILFLKYNLALRCNWDLLTEVPISLNEKKQLFAHCMLHAVFGKATGGEPQLSMEIKQEDKHIWLEINSSGEASSFYREVGEYCEDLLMKEYLKTTNLNPDLDQLLKEPLIVEKNTLFPGSRIQLTLHS